MPLAKRLVDTRSNLRLNGPVAGGVWVAVTAGGQVGIPADAAAVVLTVSVVNPTAPGALQLAKGSDDGHAFTALNYASDTLKPQSNSAVVALSTAGRFDLNAQNTVQIILDIQGYYTSGAATAGGFVPVTPSRLADSRSTQGIDSNGPRRLTAGQTYGVSVPLAAVPSRSLAVVLNLTVISYASSDLGGYLKTYSDLDPANHTTSLNYQPGLTTAINVTVPINSPNNNNKFDIEVGGPTSPVDVIVDIEGYFTASAPGGAFTAAASRVYDGANTGTGLGSGSSITIPVAEAANLPSSTNVSAVAVNLVVLNDTSTAGYLNAWATDQEMPATSVVNYGARPAGGTEIRSNMAIVQMATDGSITIRNNGNGGTVRFIVDLEGWFQDGSPASGPESPGLPAVLANRSTQTVTNQVTETTDDGTTLTSTMTGTVAVPTDAEIVRTDYIKTGTDGGLLVGSSATSSANDVAVPNGYFAADGQNAEQPYIAPQESSSSGNTPNLAGYVIPYSECALSARTGTYVRDRWGYCVYSRRQLFISVNGGAAQLCATDNVYIAQISGRIDAQQITYGEYVRPAYVNPSLIGCYPGKVWGTMRFQGPRGMPSFTNVWSYSVGRTQDWSINLAPAVYATPAHTVGLGLSWSFMGGVSQSGTFRSARCDATDSFTAFNQQPAQACVFAFVGLRIAFPFSEYPEIAKNIQNGFNIGSPRILHRLWTGSRVVEDNRDVVTDRCPSVRSVQRNPVPGSDWQCDEYPFASTAEGAASGIPFSLHYVPANENSRQGNALGFMYSRHRVWGAFSGTSGDGFEVVVY